MPVSFNRGALRRLTRILLCILLGIPAVSHAATSAEKAVGEVLVARMSLDRLRSYRVSVTLAPGTVVVLTQGATVLVEVVTPDRYRSVFKIAGLGTAESITVGERTRSRAIGARSPARWECKADDRPVQALLPVIPAKPGDIGSITAFGETTIGGTRVRGFRYQRREGTRLSTYRLYTLPARGLPRRVEAFSAQGKPDVTADYHDYNVPISIKLPPCG